MRLSFRYQENGSLIDRLNPLVKLAWVLVVAVAAVLINHPLWLAGLLLATLPVVLAGKILSGWLNMLKFTLILCLVLVVINLLVNHNGSHVLWQAGFKLPVLGSPALTLEALVYSLGMALRLLTIISVFTVLTLTIHPDDILQVMYRIRIPRKSVLVVSLATRFLPVLVDDAERISAVQQSRGLQMDRGSLVQRIRNRAAVLIPLLSNSLDRTAALAEAMEARAFGTGRTRTFFKPLKIKPLDWGGLVLCFILLAVAVLAAARGWSDYAYFPTCGPLGLPGSRWGACAALLALAMSVVPLSWLNGRRRLD